jgi:hypothetical protein
MLQDAETPWPPLAAPKTCRALAGDDQATTVLRRAYISGERTDTDG